MKLLSLIAMLAALPAAAIAQDAPQGGVHPGTDVIYYVDDSGLMSISSASAANYKGQFKMIGDGVFIGTGHMQDRPEFRALYLPGRNVFINLDNGKFCINFGTALLRCN